MPVFNCEINLILTWTSNLVVINPTGKETFAITNTKYYGPVVILSTQDNEKLL